jgi:GAF domain-containing protein
MKTPYRPPRELLAELEQVLARKYSPTDDSPLDQTAELLHVGRHYSSVSLSLVAGGRAERQVFRSSVPPSSETRSELTQSSLSQPIKLVGRVLGVIEVESDRPDAFGPKDRVLLKQVATRLARFLTGRGKYLVRKAREAAAAHAAAAAENPERHQPASERAAVPRAAAAGEKSRQ